METDQSLKQERRQDSIERLDWHHSVTVAVHHDFLSLAHSHYCTCLHIQEWTGIFYIVLFLVLLAAQSSRKSTISVKLIYIFICTSTALTKDNSFLFHCPNFGILCVKGIVWFCKEAVRQLWRFAEQRSVSVLICNTFSCREQALTVSYSKTHNIQMKKKMFSEVKY